jgi:hypothetical protein
MSSIGVLTILLWTRMVLSCGQRHRERLSGALRGAVIAAANQFTHDFDTAYKLGHDALARIGHPVMLMHGNDVGGHAAVLALFDEVIAEG